MTLGNCVVENFRFVVLDLNANGANLNLVLDDIGINIHRRDNSAALAKPYLVALNLWLRSSALNENSSRKTRHHNIFGDDAAVLRLGLNHDSSTLEVGE